MLGPGHTLLGRYTVLRRLGEGGMGTTYLVRDEVHEREAALKLLGASTPELLAAFRDEFVHLRGRFHPHLVRVHDFGVALLEGGEARPFYTAAFVDGEPLDRFARGKSFADVARPFADALTALGFLHRLGVLHGDVKPANVLVDREGRGTLIDLGCSQPLDHASSRVSGTPGFVAPEALAGLPLDRRADLFAVGVTLRELGRLTSGLPGDIERVAARLSSDDRAARPSDVDEVLEAFGEGRRVTAAVVASPKLLGRDREMARFDRMLASLLAGAAGPRALVVAGAEGAGRTRLLEDMKWRAELACVVVEGSARRPAGLSALLRRATGDASIPDGLAGLPRARAAFATATAPLVLVLDDAGLLAPAERELWDGWLRSASSDDRIALLTVGPAPPWSAPALDVLAVDPLGPAEVGVWSRSALGKGHDADVLRLTGGHPRSIERLFTLVAAGRARTSELGAVSAVELATEGALASFASLPDGVRRAVAIVAAFDGAVDAEAARELIADDAAVAAAVDVGFLSLDGATLRLARAGDAAGLLAALEPEKRRAIHAAAAAHLPRSRATSDDVDASARAASRVRHLVLAGAIDAAEAALAEHAPLVEAHPDAFATAARALAEARPRADLVLAASEVYEAAGRAEEALGMLARVLRSRPPPSVRLAVSLAAAGAYLKLGDAARADAKLGRVLGGVLDPAMHARALDRQSRVRIRQGRWADARASAELGISLAPPSAIEADLRDDLGVAASYEGDAERARAELERASVLHRELGRPRARARSAAYRALAAYRAGDVAGAARGFRDALALAESAGASDLLANGALNLGTAAHQMGDLGEALGAYERGLVLAIASGRASTEVTLRANLAKLWADVGLAERARAAAALAEARALALGMELLAGAARAVLGEAALLDGDAVAASEHLAAARARFAASGAARELAEVDVQLAEVALARDAFDEADAALERAAATASELGALDLDARVALVLGRVAHGRGDLETARTSLEAGIDRARRSQQALLLAESEARLSDVSRHAGAAVGARKHAENACELWERSAATLPRHLVDRFWAHPVRAGRREALLPAAPVAASARERKLERLLDINKKLNATLEPEPILGWAIDHALELTGAERGFVLLEQLDVAAMRNVDRSPAGARDLAFSRSIAERVVASGEPVITIDAEGDQRFAGAASIHAMRLKSVLCVPIRGQAGVLGALYVDHRFQRSLFDVEAVAVLQAFADQVAIALTNARLHRELVVERKRIEELLAGQVQTIDRLTTEVREKQKALERRFDYANIVGRSAPMQAVFATLDRVIDTPATVLVGGESGTGKELVARAIHFNGPRKAGPFVSINCGALPETLLESELFGFVRGAFTGAIRDREGLFVAARGGTLFLDELGEMPPGMQVKLLRVLQEREVQPLGADVRVPVDVRIVCATNRDLEDEVARGRFREDLYYRVAVVEIRLPPLRDRIEDLPELAARIVESAARSLGRPTPSLSRGALRALMTHTWPGNVRELENVLTKAVLLADEDEIQAEDVRERAGKRGPGGPVDRAGFAKDEDARILAALRACRWNVVAASATLGMPRATLYRRLKRLGVKRKAEGA